MQIKLIIRCISLSVLDHLGVLDKYIFKTIQAQHYYEIINFYKNQILYH